MRRVSLIVCCLLLAPFATGCALPYYWQAIGGQLELLRKRRPIEALIDDPREDADLTQVLRTVAELRRFAVTDLYLPDNDSYTTYVDLGRPYVVWNVVATERFSVEPLQWCFPFAGCVSYRGYFDRADAERFQRRLTERGMDTYSGGSGAYSTLGYFADPVLSTMLAADVQDLAGVLFHELAHQKLYVRGDSELSEAFATAVEEYGVQAWLKQRGDAAGLERYRRRIARRADFARLVATQQMRLREIFAADSDEGAKLAAKSAAFARLRAEYAELKERWGGASDYDGWFAEPLNNATLVAIATYRRWLPALAWRLHETGLAQFYADVAELAALPLPARRVRLDEWHERSLAARGLPQP